MNEYSWIKITVEHLYQMNRSNIEDSHQKAEITTSYSPLLASMERSQTQASAAAAHQGCASHRLTAGWMASIFH